MQGVTVTRSCLLPARSCRNDVSFRVKNIHRWYKGHDRVNYLPDEYLGKCYNNAVWEGGLRTPPRVDKMSRACRAGRNESKMAEAAKTGAGDAVRNARDVT